jgi:putative endonuclease
VKTRSDNLFGSPFESVTLQKQKQLSKVALEYISKQDCHNRSARFDVVGIELHEGSKSFEDAAIELLQNAFDLCYGN